MFLGTSHTISIAAKPTEALDTATCILDICSGHYLAKPCAEA